MKTIITNQANKNIIIKELLKDNNALNIDVITISNFLNNLTTKQEDKSIYEYFEVLRGMDLKYFKRQINNPSFLDELKTFIIKCKKFNLDLNLLKEDNEYFKELKKIIITLSKTRLPIDDALKAFNEITDFSEYEIIDDNTDIFTNNLYETMIKKHAQRKVMSANRDNKKDYFYTLNKKSEVELLARKLIKDQIDLDNSKITILNDEYKPFIKQVFSFHQIPYYFVSESKVSNIAFKYLTLINYYLNSNNENLISLLEEEIYDSRYCNDLIEYLKIFKGSINDDFERISQVEISDDVINKYELIKLKQLEVNSKILVDKIKADLVKLVDLDLKEALKKIDEIIINNYQLKSKEELNALYQIRNKIRISAPFLNKDNLRLLIAEIKKTKVHNEKHNNGIIVLDKDEIIGYKNNHFILGATSNNVIGFNSEGGIFSEEYLANTNYPSMANRFNLYALNYYNNVYSSDYLYVSYSISNFNGDEKKPSLEFNEIMNRKDGIYQKVDYNENTFINDDTLSKEVAEKLFFNGNILNGSISSLEKFGNCPFEYFVASGLKIREPFNYSYNNAKNGTVMHFLFEKLVEMYHKEYVDKTSDVISELLDEKIAEIVLVYPNLKPQMKIVRERILNSVDTNLKVLKDIEVDNALSPVDCEYEFSEDLKVDEKIVKIHGIVDRINSNNKYLQIIDYKSSNKDLLLDNVLTLTQLQLLTYLVVVARKFKQQVAGAFYYSFKDDTLSASYGKVTNIKKEKVFVEKEDIAYQEEYKKGKRLSGWIFDNNFEVIDANLNHIKRYKKTNTGFDQYTDIYDFKNVEALVIRLYQTIIGELKNGNIKRYPSECKYCKYHSVCHYKGGNVNKEPLEVSDDIFIVKKGKEVVKDE